MCTFKSLVLSLFASVVWILGAAQAQQPALRFVPLSPCRIADTRDAVNYPPSFGPPSLAAGVPGVRSFPILSSNCLSGVPSTVAAYSLNVTVVPQGTLGYISIWPTGQTQPVVSTLNSYDGRVKANAAIVPAGTPNGAISTFVTDGSDLVLDINGYFVPAGTTPPPLAFFPMAPCRIADTRDASHYAPALGSPSMTAGQARSFPVLSSINNSTSCNIPSTAQAYSLNFTVVPPAPLGYLTVWPTGVTQPFVSTLNAPTGAVTANAAIVPAGTNGAISAYVNDTNSDLVIDINGYFAPSTSNTDLSLYTVPPCRILDTRLTLLPTGNFVSMLTPPDDTTDAPCEIVPTAQTVVLNATVVPSAQLGFLTLWPSGQTQPFVSTLNANDGQVTSNMAIVPTTGGLIEAYATDMTALILDTSGYFASGTAPAPTTNVLNVAYPGGLGTVNSSDGKINCGAVCAVSYLSGTSVTLSATPASGHTFLGWQGAGCSGTGSCTVIVSAATPVTANFSGPSIHLNSASVGGNLETLATGSLSSAAPSGGLAVTITSSDSSKLLLLPTTTDSTGTTTGFASFTATIPAGKGLPGDGGFPGFYIQAKASSGSATITATGPGYNAAQATVTFTPSGFQLSGLSTSTLGADSTLSVSAVQLDTSGNVLSASQPLAGGQSPVSVTVNSSTPGTGRINGNAVVQPGTRSGTVTFHPVAVGTTTVSIPLQPAGFGPPPPSTGTSFQITVAQPTITVIGSGTLGFDLEGQGGGNVSLAPTSALSLTITATPAGSVLLSNSPTTLGTNSIQVQVAANTTTIPPFYIQSMNSFGSVTLTASDPAGNYVQGTAQLALTPSAFLLSPSGNNPANFGAPLTTTTLSSSTTLTLAIWQTDASGNPIGEGQLRPGISAVPVGVMCNSCPGMVNGSPVFFNGGDTTNNGVSFQPASTAGNSVLMVAQPSGFGIPPPTSGGQVAVSVVPPAVTLLPLQAANGVGTNLETQAGGQLSAPAPNYQNTGFFPVTITSNNPSVLLSASATTKGTSSITVQVPTGKGVNSIGFPTYYVQFFCFTSCATALQSSTTVQLTASAPSPFTSGSLTVNLARAGFVISGDGVTAAGQTITPTHGHSVPLNIFAVLLDSNGAPTPFSEAVSGGLSVSVQVTSSNANFASAPPNPVSISTGVGGTDVPNAIVTVNALAAGAGQQATISLTTLPTPPNPQFFPPSSANNILLVIQ